MNREAVAAIANLLAPIGVIVTLIYLSVQIRQNNEQLRPVATIAVYDYQRGLLGQVHALFDSSVHSKPE
jgi:hypothetical protein